MARLYAENWYAIVCKYCSAGINVNIMKYEKLTLMHIGGGHIGGGQIGAGNTGGGNT